MVNKFDQKDNFVYKDLLGGLCCCGWSTLFWKDGISGGGGSSSHALPPLSGTCKMLYVLLILAYWNKMWR